MAVRLAFTDDPTRFAEVPEGFTVVAVEPAVAVAAAAQGVDALPLDARLDDLELEALGEQTHERVRSVCAALDDLVAGEAPALWRFEQLKGLYDGLLWRGLGAQRLVSATGADEALLLVRAESLAARALASTLAATGVSVRTSESAVAAPESPAESVGSRLPEALRRVRRSLRRRRPRVLCLDEQYSLPSIAAALRERGADVLLWLPPVGPVPPALVPDLSGLAALFRFAEVDLWPAAEPRLRALVERELPRDAAALRAARAAIRRDRPDVLLASTYAAPARKAAAAAAREAGVPAVVARHGELAIRKLPVMVFNDLDVVSHELCWGEWEARFCERYAPRPVEAVVVGAPMIEEAVAEAPGRDEIRGRLGFGARERIVLLAPTSFSGEHWFLGRRTPVDLSYLRHQIALLEQLLAVEGVRVVVKEHETRAGPLESWARSRSLPVSFLSGGGFAELIHAADATVLDFPSTTLVQALHGSSRLYVVRHPVTAWEPGVLEHLERHGVRVAGVAGLAASLRADVAAGLFDAPISYPQAVREPLVAAGPGTAAERAADAVVAIGRDDAATTIVPG